MPRRYISLDPLISPRHVPQPLDWDREFGRAAPLEIEIGSGNGEHLARLAAERPGRDFVGIELLWGRVKKTLRKIGLAGLPNARIAYGDVQPILARLFPEQRIARAHLLFPCPWPGDEAGRHRLLTPAFLRLLNSRLETGGTLRLVTDDRPYFEWALAQVPGTGFEADSGSIGPAYDTKFERKWAAAGQAHFFRLDLSKVAHLPSPAPPEVLVRTHHCPQFEAERFAPQDDLSGEPFLIRFKGTLYDPARRIAMVHTVVVEDRLSQELWIEIHPEAGGWRIAPARGCQGLMTEGAQRALDLVHAAARATAG